MADTSRKFSFDIDSARDQLDKMIRESKRLEGTNNRVDKSDHAINAAMTGWHLHEWVWREVKEIERSDPIIADDLDPDTQERLHLQREARKRKLGELRVEIGKELGVKPADVGKAHFGQFMANRNPSIEMCRIIATGSKHTDVDNSTGTEFETYVSAAVPEPASPEVEGSTTPSIDLEVFYQGVPKIRFRDITYGSSDVFREAEQAWTDLIYSYKIDK